MADNMANNVALDWNDTIENDEQEFIILPEGDYNFVVSSFERGRFPGSAKMQACNKAIMYLQVETGDGIAICRFELILNRMMEWKISAFFRAIGRKKHGERLVMDWSNLVGARGCARFKPRNYKDRDGNDKQANDVDRFYDYDEKFFTIDDSTGFGGIPVSNEEIPF